MLDRRGIDGREGFSSSITRRLQAEYRSIERTVFERDAGGAEADPKETGDAAAATGPLADVPRRGGSSMESPAP